MPQGSRVALMAAQQATTAAVRVMVVKSHLRVFIFAGEIQVCFCRGSMRLERQSRTSRMPCAQDELRHAPRCGRCACEERMRLEPPLLGDLAEVGGEARFEFDDAAQRIIGGYRDSG